MEDKALLQMLFDRVEAVFEALAQRFGRRLTQTAKNILSSNEDAEECVNDTYLAIWNAIPPGKAGSAGALCVPHRQKYRFEPASRQKHPETRRLCAVAGGAVRSGQCACCRPGAGQRLERLAANPIKAGPGHLSAAALVWRQCERHCQGCRHDRGRCFRPASPTEKPTQSVLNQGGLL